MRSGSTPVLACSQRGGRYVTGPDRNHHLRSAWIATSIAALVGVMILVADVGLHHPLAGFRAEYVHGGSCKLRGADAFELLLRVGVLALGAAAVATVAFAASVFRSPARLDRRWVGVLTSAVVIVMLLRLDYLDPALGICPSAARGTATGTPLERACTALPRGAALRRVSAQMSGLGARRQLVGEGYVFTRRSWFGASAETCEVDVDRSERVVSSSYRTD